MRAVIAAVLAGVALAVAPVAQAAPCNNQACLESPFSSAGGPYVGEWVAHKERVVVSADGSGTEVSNYGTVTFTMGSVSNSEPTAYGNVLSGAGGHGAFVTMHLVDGGKGMEFSAGGGDTEFPFCKIVNGNSLNSADCGA